MYEIIVNESNAHNPVDRAKKRSKTQSMQRFGLFRLKFDIRQKTRCGLSYIWPRFILWNHGAELSQRNRATPHATWKCWPIRV